MMSKESYKMDMCNGPVLQKVIAFSLPLMLSSCLQLLFNAADVIVVGRFAGRQTPDQYHQRPFLQHRPKRQVLCRSFAAGGCVDP